MNQTKATRGAGRKSASILDESSTEKSTSKSSKSDKPNRQKPSEKLQLDLEIHRLIASPAPFRFQPVCPVCEVYSSAPGQMLKCNGTCGLIMHPRCMQYKEPPKKENENPEKFMCPECLDHRSLCGVCGKPSKKTGPSEELLSCQMSGCSRRFHAKCLEQHPGVIFTDELIRCPAHVCATCCLEDPNNVSVEPNRPMLQCVRCPRVYHTGDLCTPAGSVEVSLSHIVCPAHFALQLSEDPHYKTQSTSWCFVCRKAGADRIFCESCPFNCHRACLPEGENIEDPEIRSFICKNCRQRVEPRYAQVVWAKIPFFRWWPCEIIHARNAPLNIFNMAHPEGTFLIHFLGSGEYQWVCRAQTFAYEYGLNTSAAILAKSNSKKDVAFNLSAKMGPQVHEFYVNYVWKRGLNLRSMSATRHSDEELVPMSTPETAFALGLTPQCDTDAAHITEALESFKQIATNQYTKSELQKLAIKELPDGTCDCATSESVKRCLKETHCRNRLECVECTEQVCSVLAENLSDDCGNRRFSKQPKLSVFRTTNRGFGLKVDESVNEDSFVAEYVGEVIDVDEANRRLDLAIASCTLHRGHQSTASHPRLTSETMPTTYLLRFTPGLVLDAGESGSLARFVNHSCEPNLSAKLWNVDGSHRIGFFAVRPILSQEELTLDYRQAYLLDSSFVGIQNICLCGADSCSSFLRLPSAFEKPETTEITPASTHSTPVKGKSVQQDIKPVVEVKSKRGRKSQTTSNKNDSMSNILSAAATLEAKTPKDTLALPVTEPSPKGLETNSLSHEDFCYRCGDGGELVLCDKRSCPKSYHLGCIGLMKPPNGTWYCPWHFCDNCGQQSSHLCWRCPNSYCFDHADTESSNPAIKIDEIDAEKWRSTLKSITRKDGNNITDTASATSTSSEKKTALILACRWICADHASVKIYGPENRPTLIKDPVTPPQVENSENVEPLKAKRSKQDLKRRLSFPVSSNKRKRTS